MKRPKIRSIGIIILAVIIASSLAQKAYALETDEMAPISKRAEGNHAVRALEKEIVADRESIIKEIEAIDVCHRKLREANKLVDKAEAGRIKQETDKEIAGREDAIKKLKISISNKKDQKNALVYGKQKIPKRDQKYY